MWSETTSPGEIELELNSILLQTRILQINKAHLRMQCLAVQTTVTFMHGIKVQCIFLLHILLTDYSVHGIRQECTSPAF